MAYIWIAIITDKHRVAVSRFRSPVSAMISPERVVYGPDRPNPAPSPIAFRIQPYEGAKSIAVQACCPRMHMRDGSMLGKANYSARAARPPEPHISSFSRL